MRSCINCADGSAAARGRSTCLLLYKTPLGETAKARLAIMRETEDGFRIAEEDLKLRGEGDVLGTRQSGDAGISGRAARGAWRDCCRPRATTPTLCSHAIRR